MREACDELCVKSAADVDPALIFAKIKGASKLGSRKLAVLRELTILREQMACEHDVTARGMLKDEVLMELTSRQPETEGALAAIKGMPRPVAARYGEQIMRAIRRGKSLPPEQRPSLPPAQEDSTETKRLAEIMFASSQVLCLGRSVSPSLVTTKAEIQGLARLVAQGEDPSGHTLMRGWARECLGAPLLEFVRGETDMTLRVTPERMHAELEPRS
jgi:ribonuclease D